MLSSTGETDVTSIHEYQIHFLAQNNKNKYPSNEGSRSSKSRTVAKYKSIFTFENNASDRCFNISVDIFCFEIDGIQCVFSTKNRQHWTMNSYNPILKSRKNVILFEYFWMKLIIIHSAWNSEDEEEGKFEIFEKKTWKFWTFFCHSNSFQIFHSICSILSSSLHSDVSIPEGKSPSTQTTGISSSTFQKNSYLKGLFVTKSSDKSECLKWKSSHTLKSRSTTLQRMCGW